MKVHQWLHRVRDLVDDLYVIQEQTEHLPVTVDAMVKDLQELRRRGKEIMENKPEERNLQRPTTIVCPKCLNEEVAKDSRPCYVEVGEYDVNDRQFEQESVATGYQCTDCHLNFYTVQL